MHILIEKDANTKIPKEVADLDAARAYAAQGFHVSVIEDGVARPLEPEAPAVIPHQPPEDDAFVAVGATRFSDGEIQTEDSQAAAVAAWEADHPVEVTDLTDGAEITAAGVTPLPKIEG